MGGVNPSRGFESLPLRSRGAGSAGAQPRPLAFRGVSRAYSSAGERPLHTREVLGSIPSTPIVQQSPVPEPALCAARVGPPEERVHPDRGSPARRWSADPPAGPRPEAHLVLAVVRMRRGDPGAPAAIAELANAETNWYSACSSRREPSITTSRRSCASSRFRRAPRDRRVRLGGLRAARARDHRTGSLTST